MLGSACLPLILAGCRSNLALDPQGPGAAQIAQHWWLLYWAAVAVCVIVLALLAVAIWRRRRAEPTREGADNRGTALVIYGGAIIPLVLLIATTVMILLSMGAFAGAAEEDGIRVRVTGHMFWWELEYVDAGFTTANELHVPVGTPVHLELESADVIHSFWVPQLHGKMELVPGWSNELVIQADAPGSFDGFCAEYCGPQHANMRLLVIAQMPDEYREWEERQAEDAPAPESDLAAEGQEVFSRLICSNCHTVRGISEAAVDVGPDLTHLASRGTLAARLLPNTRSQLANWIMDPQSLKPGSNMPATPMTGRELDALIEFLGVTDE